MRPYETREKNPYNRRRRDPDSREDLDWANREGNELGYQRTYGEYGSEGRGWVDEPHERNWAHRGEDYTGVRPKKYQRSDMSILDQIGELITWSPDVDGSEITIAVKDGNVIVAGTVPTRMMIYIVDDLVESVGGVKEYDNHLKVQRTSVVES